MKWYSGVFLIITVVILQACSSDDDEPAPPIGDIILDNLIGEWSASRAFFRSTNLNPVQETEVIGQGGTADLSVGVLGRFSLVIQIPNENPQLTTGEFGVSGNELTVVFDHNPNVTVLWSFQLTEPSLRLQGPARFDFENDASFEETAMELDLIRN